MILRVVAKPGRRKGSLKWNGDELIVEVSARAHDGAANTAIVALLAEAFDVPKSKVQITRGASSRYKTVVLDMDEAAALQILAAQA